jgi:hypothetical protein
VETWPPVVVKPHAFVLSQGRETVSRQAHNLEIEGSTPSPATNMTRRQFILQCVAFVVGCLYVAGWYLVKGKDD